MEKMKILVNKKPNTATQFLVPLNNQPYGEPTNITEGVVAGEGGGTGFDPDADYTLTGENTFEGVTTFDADTVFNQNANFNDLVNFTGTVDYAPGSIIDFAGATLNFTGTSFTNFAYWRHGGNAGTVAGNTNEIGTTDNVRLDFITNNSRVGILPSAVTQSIVFGKNIGINSYEQPNIIIGTNSFSGSGATSATRDNVIIGYFNMTSPNQNTYQNTVVGFNCVQSLRSAQNSIFGYNVGASLFGDFSGENTLMGHNAAVNMYNRRNFFDTPENEAWSELNGGTAWEYTGEGSWERTTTGTTDGLKAPMSLALFAASAAPMNIEARMLEYTSGSVEISLYQSFDDSLIGSLGVFSNPGQNTTFSGTYYRIYAIATPSSDFVGKIRLRALSSSLTQLSNSVIVGKSASVADNFETNVIVIGYNASSEGSNTTVIGNDNIISTKLYGQLKLKDYGLGAYNDPAVKMLGTTATGQVVETDPVDCCRPYTVYTANISQIGTSDPVPTIFENSVGSIVWTRVSGVDLESNPFTYYEGTLTGAFVENKTVVALLNKGTSAGPTELERVSANIVRIFTNNTDGALQNTTIEIRVYA
jgi:hypothetical protein